MTIRIVLGFILTVSLVAPMSASAAPSAKAKGNAASASASRPPLADSLRGSAKDDYEAGKLLFSDGDYAGAALKFERAYATSRDPRLLWNQAAAERNLRRFARVESLLLRYLREEGESLSEADRAEAEALLEAVKDFVAEVKLEVSEPSAQVFVDDLLVGETPLAAPLRLDLGKRRLSVKKPGFLVATEALELTGGETRVVSISLEAESTKGRLRVVTSGGATIRVDGKVVGIGQWEGVVVAGAHQIDVVEKGKDSYRERAEVRANDLTSLQITLSNSTAPPASIERDRGGGVPAWVWVAGGVAITGIGVGTYFLLKSRDEAPPAATPGSLGTLNLPLGF